MIIQKAPVHAYTFPAIQHSTSKSDWNHYQLSQLFKPSFVWPMTQNQCFKATWCLQECRRRPTCSAACRADSHCSPPPPSTRWPWVRSRGGCPLRSVSTRPCSAASSGGESLNLPFRNYSSRLVGSCGTFWKYWYD